MREYRSADSTRDTASFSGQACTPGSPQKSLSSRSEARDLLQLPCEANCAPAKAHTLHPVSGAVSEWPTLRTLTHEHSPTNTHPRKLTRRTHTRSHNVPKPRARISSGHGLQPCQNNAVSRISACALSAQAFIAHDSERPVPAYLPRQAFRHRGRQSCLQKCKCDTKVKEHRGKTERNLRGLNQNREEPATSCA
jgi:hypothetical protein